MTSSRCRFGRCRSWCAVSGKVGTDKVGTEGATSETAHQGSAAAHLDEKAFPARNALVSHSKRPDPHSTASVHPGPEPAADLVWKVPHDVSRHQVYPDALVRGARRIRQEHERLTGADPGQVARPVAEREPVHGRAKHAGSTGGKSRFWNGGSGHNPLRAIELRTSFDLRCRPASCNLERPNRAGNLGTRASVRRIGGIDHRNPGQRHGYRSP